VVSEQEGRVFRHVELLSNFFGMVHPEQFRN
jgi:hypothetical protein